MDIDDESAAVLEDWAASVEAKVKLTIASAISVGMRIPASNYDANSSVTLSWSDDQVERLEIAVDFVDGNRGFLSPRHGLDEERQ